MVCHISNSWEDRTIKHVWAGPDCSGQNWWIPCLWFYIQLEQSATKDPLTIWLPHGFVFIFVILFDLVILQALLMCVIYLTHWGRVTHTCIGSDNDLSPRRRQAIIWTNAEILFTGPFGTNFSEIWIEILIFSSKNALKMSYKWRIFWHGLNVFTIFCRVGTVARHQRNKPEVYG